MFCPKCSARLEEDPRGWLSCSSGKLEFSLDLSRKLRTTYGKAAMATATSADLSGRNFFCPGCSTAISSQGDATCLSCGVSLHPLIWSLIELHPHGNDAGGYF